jgi:hypothetical protein
MLCGELIQRLSNRRPSDRRDRICKRLSHQRDRLSQQKDLDFMPSLHQGETMQKRERRLGWIVRTPRAFHHDVQLLFLWRLLPGGEVRREQWDGREPREKTSTFHIFILRCLKSAVRGSRRRVYTILVTFLQTSFAEEIRLVAERSADFCVNVV